eukprot:122477-Pelagomonas_calceolata.AAC.8
MQDDTYKPGGVEMAHPFPRKEDQGGGSKRKQLACQSKQLEAAGVPIEPGHAGILKGKEGVNTREVPTNCKLCRQDCREGCFGTDHYKCTHRNMDSSPSNAKERGMSSEVVHSKLSNAARMQLLADHQRGEIQLTMLSRAISTPRTSQPSSQIDSKLLHLYRLPRTSTASERFAPV